MERKELNFSLQEAGCLLYAADENLAGFPFGRFHEFFGGQKGLKELILKGAVMPFSLYQDDGYNVRVLLGEMTEEEKANWTSRGAWKLNLESGRMIVSGVCDEDLEEYMEDFGEASEEKSESFELGCRVPVPPGEYSVTVYSYPPNDLAGGWMRIADSSDFKLCLGEEADLEFERPVDYFNRTRPGEDVPAWVAQGWEEADFLDFLIHLAPLNPGLEAPRFESDGCILWEYRKPDVCPAGIRL